MKNEYSGRLTGRTLTTSNPCFYIFDIESMVGGAPSMIVDAPSLWEAVQMLDEYWRTMMPETPSCLRDGSVNYIQDCRTLAEIDPSFEEDGEMPAGVCATDLDEDQLLRRREDGTLCLCDFAGVLTPVLG